VEQVIAWGASGYLIKQSSGEVLPKAIQEVYEGKLFFSPSIARRIHTREQRQRERGTPHTKGSVPLSSREVEVLQLIAEGKANKETAAELGISIKTVEKHRQNLMEKLNIHDTAGLTRHAIAEGIIECSVRITILAP